MPLKCEPEQPPAHRDDVHSWLYLPSTNEFGIPDMQPFDGELPLKWAFFPFCGPGIGTHFYIPDERFERIWRRSTVYAHKLAEAQLLCSPDFSIWRDAPLPVALWQTYRNRYLGAWWQSLGLNVIPTVGWTDELWDFYWAGIPRHATVTVGSIGLTDKQGQRSFARGLAAMEEALEPRRVIVYGKLRYARLERAEVIEVPYSFWWRKWQQGKWEWSADGISEQEVPRGR